jgi:hypothetical protein
MGVTPYGEMTKSGMAKQKVVAVPAEPASRD